MIDISNNIPAHLAMQSLQIGLNNAMSLLRVLETSGEDILIGFKIDHRDVMNVLDVISANLLEVSEMAKIISKTECKPF